MNQKKAMDQISTYHRVYGVPEKAVPFLMKEDI
jgi:hypothetical protein